MNSILQDKSYIFAISIVKLAQFLQKDQKEVVISNQILKSGTSTGALIREAEFAQSHHCKDTKFLGNSSKIGGKCLAMIYTC